MARPAMRRQEPMIAEKRARVLQPACAGSGLRKSPADDRRGPRESAAVLNLYVIDSALNAAVQLQVHERAHVRSAAPETDLTHKFPAVSIGRVSPDFGMVHVRRPWLPGWPLFFADRPGAASIQ